MAESGSRKLWRVAAAVVPVVFLFVLYQHGLNTFFFQDDFAWLSLLRQNYNFHDFLHGMFAPMAQGDRPLPPQRARLLHAHAEDVPDWTAIRSRLVVFLSDVSQSAPFQGWLARRLTGSALAGFLTRRSSGLAMLPS